MAFINMNTPTGFSKKSAKRLVTVFTTGGTIEKTYSEQDGSISNRQSQLRQKLLSRLRLPYTDIEVIELMQKDSLEMNLQDRKIICQAIQKAFSAGHPIVVLHGTDTLSDTLSYCRGEIKSSPVAVVFTGALRPAGFDDSDALQNFTEALYAAQTAKPGLYVSFHGRLFHEEKIKKNREIGTFESED